MCVHLQRRMGLWMSETMGVFEDERRQEDVVKVRDVLRFVAVS